jgi:hypothetical protein
MWDQLEKLEDILSDRTGQKIRFSRESFYSGQENLFYKKLIIDDKQTNVRVDIMDLQPSEKRVKLENKAASIGKLLAYHKGV